ncbi:hypothetical protein [Enterococcus sp. AZ109]|uniref:hypothetical protein n=1 Tax=Enterococcus sp. AZ109 TaxID=2774634 RepID=UPI003F209466
MSWINEIYRAFFVALGAMEVFTNLTYIVKNNGESLARKQHQELPRNVSDHQIRLKVSVMLGFGVLFLVLGIYAYAFRRLPEGFYNLCLGLFAGYAALEALYYRYWKTVGFALVAIAAFLLFFLAN